jgi:hypothetical protein
MNYRRLILPCGVMALLGGGKGAALAQRLSQADMPRLFRLQIDQKYVDMNVEAEADFMQSGSPAITTERDRLLVQPALGLGLNGSIYHPNFINFDLDTELGLDWQWARITGDGEGTDANFLQRFHGSLDIMRQQPYSTSFYADKDLTYRDYDFFTRVRVDSERYGMRSGYSAGPVPFSLGAQHYEEVTDDFTRPASLTEDTVSFNAHNTRAAAHGDTELTYNLNRFTRVDDGYSDQHGLNQSVNVFDSESFGTDGLAVLSSLLNYNSMTETPVPNDKLLLQENLRLKHHRNFNSFYEYAFDTASSGDADSRTHQSRAGLNHQLYENLSTTFDLHGFNSEASSPGSALVTRRYGTTLGEQYNRRLGTWGNLFLGVNGTVDREERNADGQSLAILDEFHVLTDGTVTFLNQPSVDASTVEVTDLSHTFVYLEGLDYELIDRGLMTEIRRIPGGKIPNGGGILVSYTAVLQPSARYNAYTTGAQFRLDIWSGLIGLYGRWNFLDYSGAEQLQLRTLNDKVLGIDSTWRWLRAGGEYEWADSNFAPYERARLFQSALFRTGEGTTLGLDIDQTWSVFKDNNQKHKSLGFILRWEQALTSHLVWSTEGGVRFERDSTYDRDLATLRTGLNWVIGKLTMRIGYEFYREVSDSSDINERHYAVFRVRRSL